MALKFTGGKAVESASDRIAKAVLLDAQKSINALLRLDLPRDVESLVRQLDQAVMDHAAKLQR